MSNRPLRVGFVMEDALGHVTHAQALRAAVAADARLAGEWLPIPYRADDRLERVPGLPFSLKISLRARAAVRTRLRSGSALDGLFFHTQGLTPCCLPLITELPALISLDATPSNFAEIADAYGERPTQGAVGRLKCAWFRRVFQRARGLVAFSDWVADSLQRDYGVPATQVAVLPPGVDTRAWQPAAGPNATDQLRLLFVGADFARKGGQLLLQAWRAGLAAHCTLDIVTRDTHVADADGLRVHRGLTPNSAALKQLFARADVFVLPSRGDASPFVVLEAMASGLPVVATRVGAVAEMVDHGISGLLVPPGDAAALTAAVRQLAGDPALRAAMGRAGRARACRHFDAATNYRRLTDHLHATIGGARA
jgi:glycosyltransferase involved in cell wall biosynthesis